METASSRRSWLARLTSPKTGVDPNPLYAAVVGEARAPRWYAELGVPDTIDGRFDMVTLVLCLVLLRLERDGEAGFAVRLTEAFIHDMDGQVREIGFGDLVVGKQVGGMMASLGGRLGSYAPTISEAALIRNVWRGKAPPMGVAEALAAAANSVRARIDGLDLAQLKAGHLS